MSREAQPVAVELGESMLATIALMLLGGLVAVAIAVTRGLGFKSALHVYLWTGLSFTGVFLALIAVIAVPVWAFRRARRTTPGPQELPAEIRIASGWSAWAVAARSVRLNVAFIALIALVQPRLGAGLAGFSLLGVTLVPLWAYRRMRSNATRYIVRGPGRWQRRTYVRRRPTA